MLCVRTIADLKIIETIQPEIVLPWIKRMSRCGAAGWCKSSFAVRRSLFTSVLVIIRDTQK